MIQNFMFIILLLNIKKRKIKKICVYCFKFWNDVYYIWIDCIYLYLVMRKYKLRKILMELVYLSYQIYLGNWYSIDLIIEILIFRKMIFGYN